MTWIILIVILAAVAAAFLLLGRVFPSKKRNAENSLIDLSRCKISTTTPSGARLFSVNPVAPPAVAAIDYALFKLFDLARARGYTEKLHHSDYKIYIVPPTQEFNSAGEYVPNFALNAPNYDGSNFDLDPTPGVGRVLAAEFVLPDMSGFVLPEYTREYEKFGEIAHYGAEHIILFYNDKYLFELTKTHGDDENDGHPIIK